MERIAQAMVLALVLGLVACASPPASNESPPPKREPSGLQDAAIAPLHDLNLVRVPIPPVLAQAQKAPYALPQDDSCDGLAAEVEALDAALGPDLDAAPGNRGAMERGSQVAGEVMVSAVRSTTESVIPFRSWVRRLTGAERYSKDVAAAITAGTVRRSFLKGLGQAAACDAPASPKSWP